MLSNAIVAAFIVALVMIFGALAWVLFGSALGFAGFCTAFALLALVLSAGLWYVVNTWGAKRFSAL